MKTIEEAAIDFISPVKSMINNLDYMRTIHAMQIAFKEGVIFAQKWIPVDEELPEESEYYLVRCMNGKRIQTDVDFFDGKFLHRTNVTHWRYIELK